MGVAPDANLIAVKAADDQGGATVLNVIYGIQFAIDHQRDYNIRVLNLSLNAATAQSYQTDPLDAAVETLWSAGIVVVASAGNNGTSNAGVLYAPANDPFVITVGAVNDQGTVNTSDDTLAAFSAFGSVPVSVTIRPDALAGKRGATSFYNPFTERDEMGAIVQLKSNGWFVVVSQPRRPMRGPGTGRAAAVLMGRPRRMRRRLPAGSAAGHHEIDAGAAPELILIATGSEVSLALEAHQRLVKDGIRSRLV